MKKISSTIPCIFGHESNGSNKQVWYAELMAYEGEESEVDAYLKADNAIELSELAWNNPRTARALIRLHEYLDRNMDHLKAQSKS